MVTNCVALFGPKYNQQGAAVLNLCSLAKLFFLSFFCFEYIRAASSGLSSPLPPVGLRILDQRVTLRKRSSLWVWFLSLVHDPSDCLGPTLMFHSATRAALDAVVFSPCAF